MLFGRTVGEPLPKMLPFNTTSITTGGTSGSLIFDQAGWVIAVNHSGFSQGSLSFGIQCRRSVGEFIDCCTTPATSPERPGVASTTLLPQRPHPSATYGAFPRGLERGNDPSIRAIIESDPNAFPQGYFRRERPHPRWADLMATRVPTLHSGQNGLRPLGPSATRTRWTAWLRPPALHGVFDGLAGRRPSP